MLSLLEEKETEKWRRDMKHPVPTIRMIWFWIELKNTAKKKEKVCYIWGQTVTGGFKTNKQTYD